MVTEPVNSSACADTSGVSRQRVPDGRFSAPSQNVSVVKGAVTLRVCASKAWAFAISIGLSGVFATACCQLGIVQDAEMPPPPAPHCAPSSQTCSEGGWVASSIVVPPTERT